MKDKSLWRKNKTNKQKVYGETFCVLCSLSFFSSNNLSNKSLAKILTKCGPSSKTTVLGLTGRSQSSKLCGSMGGRSSNKVRPQYHEQLYLMTHFRTMGLY